MRTSLAIVVINYKMESLTAAFVNEELSKIGMPHKTVIVNNSSSPESNLDLCRKTGAVEVSLDSSPEPENSVFLLPAAGNVGFAKGNNLGAEFCRKWLNAEFILFSNNDVRLTDPSAADILVEKLLALPDVGVIGPRVIGLDGKLQSPYPYLSFWDREVWMYWSTLFYSKEKKIRRFQLDYPEKALEGYHYYVMGSFFIVRASDFYSSGMFDPHTFLYAEEMILSERMGSIGKRVYYYPGVTVTHVHGATTSRMSSKKASDWQFESVKYYYKAYRHTNCLLLLLGNITHGLRKLK